MPDPKNGKVSVLAKRNSAPLMSRISMASAAYAMSARTVNVVHRGSIHIGNAYLFLPCFLHHIYQSRDPTA